MRDFRTATLVAFCFVLGAEVFYLGLRLTEEVLPELEALVGEGT